MSLKLLYYGSVKNGQIKLPKRMRKEITQAFDGKTIRVIVERKRAFRSSPQNRYYWGVVIPEVMRGLIDAGNYLQIGNPEHHELVHQFLKEKFLQNGQEVHDSHGTLYRLPSSTTGCSVSEMSDYIDCISMWALEYLNVQIPEPNEQLEIW